MLNNGNVDVPRLPPKDELFITTDPEIVACSPKLFKLTSPALYISAVQIVAASVDKYCIAGRSAPTRIELTTRFVVSSLSIATALESTNVSNPIPLVISLVILSHEIQLPSSEVAVES